MVAQNINDRSGNIRIPQDACPHRIVDIVIDIGDSIGMTDDLSLQSFRDPVTGVTQNTHTHLVCQVQTLAVLFQYIHNSQALLIVAEGMPHAVAECALTGVTKGSVSQIVTHRDSLRQILIEIQRPGNGSCNAGYFNCVGHPGAVVVALRIEKDLGFMHQPAEGLTMDDPVRISLIVGTHILFLFRFRSEPSLTFIGKRRIFCQAAVLQLLQISFRICHSFYSFPLTGNARYS